MERYKPQKTTDKDGNPIKVQARSIETVLKIYKDYLEDETTQTTYRDQNIYDTVRKANATLKRGLEQVLEPKGYDINFDFEQVNGRINTEIEEKQRILEERTGTEAVSQKAEEIIKDREQKGLQTQVGCRACRRVCLIKR